MMETFSYLLVYALTESIGSSHMMILKIYSLILFFML